MTAPLGKSSHQRSWARATAGVHWVQSASVDKGLLSALNYFLCPQQEVFPLIFRVDDHTGSELSLHNGETESNKNVPEVQNTQSYYLDFIMVGKRKPGPLVLEPLRTIL